MTKKKMTEKELVEKANQPGIDAMRLHPFYRGKLEVMPKCRIKSADDFGIWYTPGVAKPCMDIYQNPEKVYEHTNKWNFVAIVTNGTRVLGLGNIGPMAGLPVMEGKAILFKYLGGVDAFPLCLGTENPKDVIQAVKWLEPTFGGVNLEDIEKPECFEILTSLQKQCNIPVWHDDQQGTAAVTLAGFLNALKIVKKKINEVKIAMVGAGASNVCIARLLIKAGVDSGNIIMVDSRGTLHKERTALQWKQKEKWELCQITNKNNVVGQIPDAIKGADVLIALSTPGPDVIKKEWIKTMNDDAIVFACANPTPEIWPWVAKEAGARIVATGRSDFPNQVNNSLGFPGIFRGTLDVMATSITDEMCVASSEELAKCAEDKGISEEYLIPTMDEWEVYPRVATAVGLKAIEQGLARVKLSKEDLFKKASEIIKSSREKIQLLMDKGYIKLGD